MLISLTLHQFALISQHELTFANGFNVLTGETGAGKSLLLDALALCIGERADSGMVRHGADTAEVYAEFDVSGNKRVESWFIDNERLFSNELLIRRQLSRQGRSKAWLNGLPISLAELKSLGTLLVNIHSQYAQQALLKPQFVIDWLDAMAGIEALAKQTRQNFSRHQTLKRQVDELKKASTQRQDRIDLLSNQLNDIEPLLQVNYTEVEAEYDELSNRDSLMQEASQALQLLESDGDEPTVSGLLGKVIRLCDHKASMSATFQKVLEQLYIAQEHISEASALLSDYADQELPDPKRLQQLNETLSLAHRLSLKYHLPAESLIEEAKLWQQELDELLNQPSDDDLQQQLQEYWQDYLQSAEALNQARQQVANEVSQLLVTHLQPLALPNVCCEFQFSAKEPASYNANGTHEIELLFSANVGMPMQPLYKTASGGELSRMALVMQVLQATQSVATDISSQTQDDMSAKMSKPMLVFDEVDVGISGGTAQIVGELLRQLGQSQQLLAITHQAQVASQAHQHILVQKHHEIQSESSLSILTGEAQVDELARMSGGVTITEVTKDHARSLLAGVKS